MSKNVKPATGFIDRTRAQQLVEKWAPVLDHCSDKVSAISNEHTRLNTAILMENQEKWCLQEAGNTAGGGGVFGTAGSMGFGGAVGNGDSYATGDARLPKVLIPMVRRTFPELITNEIVGVQPMSGPVGLAFALRYRYEADSLGANGIDGYATGSTTYGAGIQRAGAGNADGNELGYQYLDTRFTGTSSAALSGDSSFEILASDQGVAALLSQFELTGNIPQVTVEFSKTAVEAGTRRLAARWSVELEQDLKNMNGLDIDSELTNAMSYELQSEIDREMVIRMIQVALNAGAGMVIVFGMLLRLTHVGSENATVTSILRSSSKQTASLSVTGVVQLTLSSQPQGFARSWRCYRSFNG